MILIYLKSERIFAWIECKIANKYDKSEAISQTIQPDSIMSLALAQPVNSISQTEKW